MRRRFLRLSPKLVLVVGGAVVLLGLGLTASLGLASSGGRASPQYTYPGNPPPPPPPPPPSGPPPPPGPKALTTEMLGKNEVPKGSPTASGKATITLNATKGTVCWKFTVKGLDTVNASHIHKGPKGKSGNVVVPLFVGKLKTRGCVNASKSLVAAIQKSPKAYYVNIHTNKYPAGAIRGQL